MEWNESLSVGVPAIDAQHRSLIQAVNDLFAACSEGQGRKKIADTMRFLQNYVVRHFADEEKLQINECYPDYIHHRQLHVDFVAKFRQYEEQLENEGPTVALVAKFNTFVSSWLIYHISREDKKIGNHIASRKNA